MSVLTGAQYAANYTAPSALGGSVPVLTVTAPDSTTSTPDVTVTGSSSATAIVLPSQVGMYLLVWSTETDVQTDQFSVIAPGLHLVNLGDVRDMLNISPTDHTKDALLNRFIRTADDVIENITDPILPATRTDTFDGDNQFFVLPFRWVSAISDVHETRGNSNYVLTEQPLGFSTDSYGYTWDRNTNTIVRRAYGGDPMQFPPGINVVSCTYTLGMSNIPQDIQDAASMLIQHWYTNGQVPQKNGWGNAQSAPDQTLTVVGGYLIPNAVAEILTPYARRPGMF